MSGFEEVLAAHGAIGYDDCDGCECGADVRSHEAHRAHVAAELTAWADEHMPKAYIERSMDAPTACRVTLNGRTIFAGLDYSDTLRELNRDEMGYEGDGE